MPPHRRAALVWTVVIAFLTLLCVLGAVGLAVVEPGGGAAVGVLVGAVLAAPGTVLGLVVARRRPANPVAPVLALIGLVIAAVSATDAYGLVVGRRPGLLPVSDLYVSVDQGAWMWLYVPIALLMLVFPDGRFLTPRWRWVAVGLLAIVLLFGVVAAMAPMPYLAPYEDAPHAFGTLPAWTNVLVFALLPPFMGLLVACAASMIVRYRRASDPVLRAQLRWFALAGMLLPVTLLLCWISYLVVGNAEVALVGLAALYVCVPVAATIAMLRHDLYDVDRVLAGTVTYALVTSGLLAVFSAASVVGGLTIGGQSALVAAGATAITAAALAPLRRRVQHVVDRRLYPLRTAALTAIDNLRRRTIADEARPEELESALQTALRDPGLRVGYRLPDARSLVDASGAPLDLAAAAFAPVMVGGREIGVIISSRTPRELLREVAAAAGLLVEVVRLRVELSHALGQVEQSRSRLLQAGYDERRRLERDLHDGAQQRLVSLGMAMRVAQRHLEDGTVDVDGLLDQSVAELATAVAELRTLAHGLRPSSLDDGLGPALAALTQRVPVVVELDVRADELPDDIATTAYYVASEAIANSVKHAAAARIGLLVARQNGQVHVRVSDDGVGGAIPRTGSGLTGLSDRVAASGGRLSVESSPGCGTVVEAVLPCAS